ncbi:MAG TPA: dynamin family protein [Bryobacteraceae bacterium]|jgi:GTP-binding protein EngB required for normal cell division
MIPRTHDIHPETSGTSPTPDSSQPPASKPSDSAFPPALDLAAELAAQYEISDLSALLASARASAAQDEISVAVLGRFKAGKSSFLNHFIRRNILPVGVVPVTAVVTEIRYGVREEARVHHRDGRDPEVPLDQIGGYISEKENPENARQVDLITVELPELRRFRGLKFVDTPGLESALSHNTQTSLNWLPNVGLALVAVSVDPPLSQRDIDLLRSLYQYTPKVAVLLTKADLLGEHELAEVAGFVRTQLARNFRGMPRVFPYSTKPGFERFREALEAELAGETLERLAEQRAAILNRKMDTLLRECGDYLALSLKSAEMVQSERQALKQQVIGEKEIVDEVKSAIRLVVQHAAGGTRAMISHRLEAHQNDLERVLLEAFESEFPKWTKSLATMLRSFEDWLADALRDELTVLSVRERNAFLAPLHRVEKQAFRALQQFRDRLSDRAMRAFGVPLRTTETEIGVVEPGTPDIRIGRVFDRNWELLSPILPVWMIKAAVRRHFARTISYLVYQNLSRLSTQWEESIRGALNGVEKEARRRLDELLGTVERLVERGGNERVPQLRADLERIEMARKSLAAEAGN